MPMRRSHSLSLCLKVISVSIFYNIESFFLEQRSVSSDCVLKDTISDIACIIRNMSSDKVSHCLGNPVHEMLLLYRYYSLYGEM